MKVQVLGKITKEPNGRWSAPIVHCGNGWSIKELDPSYSPDNPEPIRIPPHFPPYGQIWAYRGKVYLVKGTTGLTYEEIITEIKYAVQKSDNRYERIKRELKAFEAFERAEGMRRERISDSVRLFVWQRDEGKCVKCGSTNRLEFDHIIPVAKGGSNTERNIQLLCEACNRSKGANI
jgi:hypothetical protein